VSVSRRVYRVRLLLSRTVAFLCVGLVLGPAFAATSFAETLEELVIEGITPDALAVTGAVAQLLRGRSEPAAVAPVVVSGALAEPVTGHSFLYDPFDIAAVSIGNYGPVAGGGGKINLTGMLHYNDAWGRRATASFGADYAVAGQALVVENLDARPLHLPLPEVELFFVPAAQAPVDVVRALPRTFDPFYAFAHEYAVAFDPPWGVPSAPAEYYILAFFMERISPDARVEMVIGGGDDSLDGDASGEMLFDDLGFPVLAARVRLTLNTEPETLIKIIHTPGSDVIAEHRQPALVGLFSTVPVLSEEIADAPEIDVQLRPLPDYTKIERTAAPTMATTPAPAPATTTSPAPAQDDLASRLGTAKSLFENGLITEDEYEAKRRDILSDL